MANRGPSDGHKALDGQDDERASYSLAAFIGQKGQPSNGSRGQAGPKRRLERDGLDPAVRVPEIQGSGTSSEPTRTTREYLRGPGPPGPHDDELPKGGICGLNVATRSVDVCAEPGSVADLELAHDPAAYDPVTHSIWLRAYDRPWVTRIDISATS